jgi:tetratricopeptide (TPR) repeat protein
VRVRASPASGSALAWCALLVAAVCAIYWRVHAFEFVHYDDLEYVLKEPYVRQGLTWAGVVWAFTETQVHNWHPVTMLSYLVDAELWGMTPGAFHLVNVVLHAADAVLLFLVLRRMTGRVHGSGIVAALFAVHPLHVESVAWVAERKDVLSTFFLLSTLWAYAAWVERPSAGRYALVAVLFALGLMSKPMLVTLPFLLLLVDYWPLGRFAPEPPDARAWLTRLRELALEKWPLFAMTAAASVVTFVVQRETGAMTATDQLSLLERLANAAQSYLRYLGLAVWPARLGVMYPLPPQISLVHGALAAGVVLAASAAVLRAARSAPHFFTGWFWYLGTLVPVIGLVQVGYQSHADRYTYVPLIGIFVAAVWAVAGAVTTRRARAAAAALTAAALLALSVRAWQQVGYWRNSETLYERALVVAPNSPNIRWNMAMLLTEHGRPADAIPHLRHLVTIAPNFMAGYIQLVLSLIAVGDLAGAEQVVRELRQLAPDAAQTHLATAIVALQRGDLRAAEREADAALALDPKLERARNVLRQVYAARRQRAGSPQRP